MKTVIHLTPYEIVDYLRELACVDERGLRRLPNSLDDKVFNAAANIIEFITTGHKIVPQEPTDEMMLAGVKQRNDKSFFNLNDAFHVYCAMIAAAPTNRHSDGNQEGIGK